MNFEFADQINPKLVKGDFSGAFEIGERELSKLPESDFHNILGKSLLNQTDNLVHWIDYFYNAISKKGKIATLYFELNEFDINTDEWYITGFGFKQDGGLEDLEWLTDVSTELMTREEFNLHGLEALQKAFEKFAKGNKANRDARDWCEHLIIARFLELMRAAHLTAKSKQLKWSEIPVYCTEHEYDFVYKSMN